MCTGRDSWFQVSAIQCGKASHTEIVTEKHNVCNAQQDPAAVFAVIAQRFQQLFHAQYIDRHPEERQHCGIKDCQPEQESEKLPAEPFHAVSQQGKIAKKNRNASEASLFGVTKTESSPTDK